jgi:dimethylaniline monooxygenase (N-oxide forming)
MQGSCVMLQEGDRLAPDVPEGLRATRLALWSRQERHNVARAAARQPDSKSMGDGNPPKVLRTAELTAPLTADVAVIGAGSSGLAILKALLGQGISVVCFERGSDVGGQWRYNNDNGLSSAYESLRTNVSRKRMEYPSFPMPDRYGDFPHHTDMAEYLNAYADSFGLREHIKFRASVTQLDRQPDRTWRLDFEDRSRARFAAVVVAVGHFWAPKRPAYPGTFTGESHHSHDYRTAQPFAGRRVLVVGGGQSAAEIACEVAKVAARTLLSVRHIPHVVPRWIAGAPYDRSDVEPLNRLPWVVMNLIFGRAAGLELGPFPSAWRPSGRRIMEGVPIVSSDLIPALRRGDIHLKPAVKFLGGDHVFFGDGTDKTLDCIIYATGYRISLPFVPPRVLEAEGREAEGREAEGRELSLYRRILPPGCEGLFFGGFVDAPGGLLPLVETQGEWIAKVLTGSIRLPPPEQMRSAIDRSERRTRQRFPDESYSSLRCDPHAYRRLLRSDLRRSLLSRAYRRIEDVTIRLRTGPRLRTRMRHTCPGGTRSS